MICNREAAKQHDITVSSSQWRDQKVLEMLQFSLTCGLYSKTEHYFKRKLESTENKHDLAKPNQNKSAATEEGGSWESLYILVRSNTFSILFSSPGDSELWYREGSWHISLGMDFGMIGWICLITIREEHFAVQRCYHIEQLCLHYQVTVLIICRCSSFSTGWNTSLQVHIQTNLCSFLGLPFCHCGKWPWIPRQWGEQHWSNPKEWNKQGKNKLKKKKRQWLFGGEASEQNCAYRMRGWVCSCSEHRLIPWCPEADTIPAALLCWVLCDCSGKQSKIG